MKNEFKAQQKEEQKLLRDKNGKYFIYENHSWDDMIYFTTTQKGWEERFCPLCDAYDKLLLVCETEEQFDQEMKRLAIKCSLSPSKEYDYFETVKKYGLKE
jgi:hypothetical protein